MLFVPGHRSDLIDKAIRSEADAIIIDLEDAVAPSQKITARQRLAELPESPVPYFVRTNGPETQLLWDDIEAAVAGGLAGVIIPKIEHADLIRDIDEAVSVLEAERDHDQIRTGIIPMIESALGVRATYEMCSVSDRVECVMFGSGEQGDLVADLGAEWTPEGTGLMYARSKVLMDARAAGIQQPMEAVFMDFRDLDALRVECEIGRRLGYVGKVAIHPAQLAVIHDVFTPSADEVAHSQRIIDAFDHAVAAGEASIGVDGKMVDFAVARVARAVIARAGRAERAT